MRIGLFTDVYKPSISGVVVAVETLKKSLEEEGHQVFVITMNNNPHSHRYIRKNNCLMIPGIPTGIYDFSLRVTYPLKAIKMIKDLDLDIIHSHTEFGMGHLAKSMAKKLDIPVVHTYHTMYQDSLDYVTKGLFPKTSQEALKLYIKSFFRNTIREIIVPTNKTRTFLQKEYHLKNNMNVIANGIDVANFFKENINQKEVLKLKKSLKIKEDDFIILWVGRLGYEKRIDYLIERQTEIVKKHKNCKLIIVGGGPEEKKLKALVIENNVKNNVVFVGKINHELIKNYYQIASIVATASFFETQGLTLVEAMAGSIPVICSSDEVFKDVVKNDYNGHIFRSKKDYCTAIEELIENPSKLQRISENARLSAEAFSLDIFAKKILKVYQKALKEKSRKKDENDTK